MTSSLVGSEMCIRDRCLLVSHSQKHATDSGSMLEGGEVPALLGLPIIEAVSYTHLTLPTICSV
eukprot:10778492-Prorocentrum_lima.AAC.1